MAKKKPTAIESRMFSKVNVAREMLKERAEEILAEYIETAKAAREAGEFEAAGKMYWNLIEHMPADNPNERMVDTSVDKQPKQVDNKASGPTIKIGLALGGLPQHKQLTAAKHVEVVEARTLKDEQ